MQLRAPTKLRKLTKNMAFYTLPLKPRSSILRPQNTSEGYSGRFFEELVE
jgi:hypothetical protein